MKTTKDDMNDAFPILKEIMENPLTEEELKEIREAAKKPIVYDEDCPKLSPAMLKALKSSVAQRNRRKNA